jgi:cell division protein FtsB
MNLNWDRSTLYRNLMLVLALLLMAMTAHELFGDHGYLAMRREHAQYDQLQQQIQKLQKENKDLDDRVKALQNDPKAIERIAREQMRMTRPGERVYTIPAKPSGSSTPPSSDASK